MVAMVMSEEHALSTQPCVAEELQARGNMHEKIDLHNCIHMTCRKVRASFNGFS